VPTIIIDKTESDKLQYEWDEDKRQSNLDKHGLDFAVAWMVLENPLSRTYDDLKHSQNEMRKMTIGPLKELYVVVVIHTDRHGVTRIISFRRANDKERKKLWQS